MVRFGWVMAGLAVGLVLVGCERTSAVRKADNVDPPEARARQDRGTATTAEKPPRQLDGKPWWAASRRGTAEENAARSFERNGSDLGASDLDDFVHKTHAFVRHPPAGSKTLTRSNGDTLIYDPAQNLFAVVTRDGAPRTLFKPREGAAYWEKQTEDSRKPAQAD